MTFTFSRCALFTVVLAAMAVGLSPQRTQGQVIRPPFYDEIEWESGGPSTDFMDSKNWSPEQVPDNPNPIELEDGIAAVIRSGAIGGNQATIGDGDVVSPDDLYVFTGVGDAGVLNVEGGELNVGFRMRVETEVTPDGCCWIPDGRDTSATFNQTGGAVTIGADFLLGRDNNVPTKGIYNMSGGTLDIGGRFMSGDSAAGEDVETGSAIANISGGTVTVRSNWSGTNEVGDPVDGQQQNSRLAGQFNLSGTGTVVFENPDTSIQLGQGNAGDGLISVKDNASLTINGPLAIAQQQTEGDFNKGELRVEGGTVSLANLQLGGWQKAGLDPALGREQALFNLSGGAVTAAAIQVGGFYNAQGELNVSGGTLVVAGETNVAQDVEGTPGAVGTVAVSGGSFQTGSLSVGVSGEGTVDVSGGTLKVDAGLVLGVTVDGQGTLNLTGGVLDMSGSDISIGDGDGVIGFDGGTLLDAANINSDLVNNGGTLSPGGSAGTTNIAGDYLVVSGTAALDIELGGTADGEFDRLTTTGAMLLDGTLDVSLINGFSPSNGDSFDILDFESLTGTFASGVNLPALGGGLTWDQTNLYTMGVLSVAGGGVLVGDFNLNGVLDAPDIDDLTGQSAAGTNDATYDLNNDSLVNADDVTVWIEDLFDSWVGDANLDGEFSTTDLIDVLASGTYEVDVDSNWSSGDFDGSGRTDSTDLIAALAGGGFEAGPRAAVASVPEPSSLLILLPAALFFARRVRRRLAA